MTARLIVMLALLATGGKAGAVDASSYTAKPSDSADPESGQGRAMGVGSRLIGRSAPAIAVRTIDGETIDLAKLYGHKPIYLKFWATWCAPCRQQMPAFEKDFEQHSQDMQVIAVDTGFNETTSTVLAFRQQHGLKMPIAIDDGSLAAAFDLRVTPQHIVIGRDGRILYVGHLEDDRLQNALQTAVAEKGNVAGAAVAAKRSATFDVGDLTQVISTKAIDGGPLIFAGPSATKLTAMVFMTPWCESYYAESRPLISQACRRVREQVSALSKNDNVRWLGVASGLWTSPKDLTKYHQETLAHIPFMLDEDGSVFRAFKVRDVPVVVLIDASGRIIRRIDPDETDLAGALAAAARS